MEPGSSMNRDQINIRSTLGTHWIEVHFLCTVVIGWGWVGVGIDNTAAYSNRSAGRMVGGRGVDQRPAVLSLRFACCTGFSIIKYWTQKKFLSYPKVFAVCNIKINKQMWCNIKIH